MFTSRRLYGNVATINAVLQRPAQLRHRAKHVDDQEALGRGDRSQRAAGHRPVSHPAFYLPAQELLAGNARGFWAVDPCHADGDRCETGDECCGGYCRPSGDGGALICTKQQPSCSQEFEKCTGRPTAAARRRLPVHQRPLLAAASSVDDSTSHASTRSRRARTVARGS